MYWSFHPLWIRVKSVQECVIYDTLLNPCNHCNHYNDVIMGAVASLITSLTTVYSIVYSGSDQRKHQSLASLAFVRGCHRWLLYSPHKWRVARKMFPFDDVIMVLVCASHGVLTHKSLWKRPYSDKVISHRVNNTHVEQHQCLLNKYVGDTVYQLMIYTVRMCTGSVKYI